MSDQDARLKAGCMSLLGGPLLAFGLWMIAQALLLPHEAETVRLSIITGAFAALGGGWLLAKRMRRVFERRGAPPAGPPPSSPQPSPAGGSAHTSSPTALEALTGAAGCLVISLAFLLVGPVFLYFYFSGAPVRRGNPVMALVAGIVFTFMGLLSLYLIVSGSRQERRAKKSRDPRRLP